MQELLAHPGYDRFSKPTSVQVDQKIFIAMNSTDPSNQMAEFMRWATEVNMEFLTNSSRSDGYAVGSALSKLKKVKKCLLENTSKVDQSIQLNNSGGSIDCRNAKTLKIPTRLLRAIVKHHREVSDSRSGVEELLLLAEEVDFVKRHHDNKTTLHATFAKHESHGLPLKLSLGAMAFAIRNHIEQRGHPMPHEYAIKIVAEVIPMLTNAVLERLPLHRWSRWFQEVGLEQIGERLAADVDRQLLPRQGIVTPSPHTVPSVYNTARTHQQSSVARISPSDILEALEDPSGDEKSIASHRTSLFGSRQSTPTNAPVHSAEIPTKRPMKLALPPTPPDQKRPQQVMAATQAAVNQATKKPRTLPPSEDPPTSTISDQRPLKEPAGKSEMYRANDLRYSIQRARVPLDFSVSRATPSGSKGGSEFTSDSTPTARIEMWQSTVQPSAESAHKRQQKEQDMAGTTEGAGDTIGRLRKTRPLKLETDTKTRLRLVARMVDQQYRRPDIGSGSENDSEEDVQMVDGVDDTSNDCQAGAYDESESESESESLEKE